MTGNRRELGGSFALGPQHVRRAGYGTIQLAGNEVFGREPKSSERSYVCAPLTGRDRKKTGGRSSE
jgi:hypothetical protein